MNAVPTVRPHPPPSTSRRIVLALAAALLAACGGTTGEGETSSAGSDATDDAEGLDLTSGAGYAHLVGVASSQCANRLLVSPGAPAESYLLDKLLGQNICSGSQMPKAGSLPAADIEAVTSWICSGAAP